jgi:hypothetical protein
VTGFGVILISDSDFNQVFGIKNVPLQVPEKKSATNLCDHAFHGETEAFLAALVTEFLLVSRNALIGFTLCSLDFKMSVKTNSCSFIYLCLGHLP